VFPDAEDPPTSTDEQSANGQISGFVAVYFWFPVSGARLGHTAMPTAAVPEATINKDREAGTPEDEIRPTREGLATPPPRNAVSAQNLREL